MTLFITEADMQGLMAEKATIQYSTKVIGQQVMFMTPMAMVIILASMVD